MKNASCRGISLIEVMVAVALLVIVFAGLASFYSRGGRHIVYEEDRRKASAVAQMRLEGLRRDYLYDDLVSLNGSDTTYVVDGRQYLISHDVTDAAPEAEATTIALAVQWRAQTESGSVVRTMGVTTIVGRPMP